MLSADRRRTIMALALPIVGGMTSQNILNLIDTAMVGALGPAALAAVGIGGFANFMAIAAITGLSSGVQAIAARRTGEGRHEVSAWALNGGLLLALAIGLPLSIFMFFATPTFFPYLIDDPAVIPIGSEYLQMRLIGMIAVGMNFSFRGYWNGVNRSGLYMRTLLLMHAVNVVLNYGLIFGNLGLPEMGAAGAGLGTTISLYIGTAYYFFLGFKHARPNGFMHGLPSRAVIANMLRVSFPASVQQLFFAAGLTMMYWIIGQIGTLELAAASVLVNIMLVAILPGIALGLTAASLAGQALGRGDAADARQWGWDVVKVGVTALALLGLPMALFPDAILSLFLHDPATLDLARLPLQITGIAIAFDGVGLILMNALHGVGATSWAMRVSLFMQWIVFMPLAYLVGPVLGWGLLAVWIAQFSYRGLQSAWFAWLWQRGRWEDIKV